MPESYINRPQIFSHLDYIIKAFSELDPDRGYVDIVKKKAVGDEVIEQILKTPLPNPFKSIAEYARIYNYEDDFEEFLYLLRKVDYYYIAMYGVE